MSNQVAGDKPRLPLLTDERREFPKREKQPVLEELDASGEVIFRFKIDAAGERAPRTLEEFYRHSLRDLLRIVRLYSRDKPVIVDGFAFLNAPDERLPILDPPRAADAPAPGDATPDPR